MLSQFGDVKLSVLFKIFDSKILPILLYRSEIRFSHASPDIEMVHNQFCKYGLRLPIYAPNVFVHSELGHTKMKFSRNLELLNIGLEFRHCQKTRFPKL